MCASTISSPRDLTASVSEEQSLSAVIAGQLFVISIKGDVHDLELLRRDMEKYLEQKFSALTLNEKICILQKGSKLFFQIFSGRYSLVSEAEELLETTMNALIARWLRKDNILEILASLKKANAWSGLSGALQGLSAPATLLDYSLRLLIPLLFPDYNEQIKKELKNIYETEGSLESLDVLLSKLANTLCFSSNLNRQAMSDIKLAIFAKYETAEPFYQSIAGVAFKLLIFRYEQEI